MPLTNDRTSCLPLRSLLIGGFVLVASMFHNGLLPESILLGGLLIWLPLSRHLSSLARPERDPHTTSQVSISRVEYWLRVAFWPCVLAAAGSTFLPRGSISGAIASCWFAWAVASAGSAIRRFIKTPRSLSTFAATVSSGYLVVSAAWFTCWRSRINPLDFPDGITLLTGVHFLYAGYLLPTIAIGLFPASLAHRHRMMLIGMMLIMPIIAVGITCSPTIEIVGVLLAMLVVLLFCSELVMMAAGSARPRTARVLLAVAAVSGVFAVGLAVYYGFSEYTGNTWILIPTMIRWHGVLNSVGLIGGSLLAWAVLDFSEARSVLPSATATEPARLSPDLLPNNSELYRESCASTDSQNR